MVKKVKNKLHSIFQSKPNLLFLLFFAVIAILTIVLASAAPFLSVEVEGTSLNNLQTISDSNASGGSYLSFPTVQTTPNPSPSPNPNPSPSPNPNPGSGYSILLLTQDANALTGLEQSLIRMLRGNGHNVTVVTSPNNGPPFDRVSHPNIDFTLSSPSLIYSLGTAPTTPNALPMLDMSIDGWYVRNVLPSNDNTAGTRRLGSYTSDVVFYENTGVIPWNQPAGQVQISTSPSNISWNASRQAMNYSTNGGAQYFLRSVSDSGQSTMGVYVPPGSTLRDWASGASLTSVAPWLGLLVGNGYGGNDNFYDNLTPAGEALFEAAFQRLMNP